MTSGPSQGRYTRGAEKALGRLDPPIRQRIVAAIDGLAAGDASGVIRLEPRIVGGLRRHECAGRERKLWSECTPRLVPATLPPLRRS